MYSDLENPPISEDECSLVSNLQQEVYLLLTKKVSENYRNEIEAKIDKHISKDAQALLFESVE